MNLDELKLNVDHFFEKVNRYGQLGSGNVQVGILLECGKLVMSINSVGTNQGENLLILNPTDKLMVVPTEPPKPPPPEEDIPEIERLSRELKIAESTVAMLRSENKKLRKKLDKNDSQKETGAVKTVSKLD